MAHYLRTSPDFNPARYVKIVGTESIDTYTVYNIELSFGPYRWLVSHRYNEFRELHEKLVSKRKIEKSLLPPKKLFGNNSELFIRKRQGELELYLQTLLYKLKIVPPELGIFLEFDKYEIHGITQVMAEELYHKGDLIKQAGEPYQVSPLQLHAITNRLKLPEPTCESGDAEKDIGHVLDFITTVKSVKIVGQRDQIGASNILMNDLNFDLNMFRALEVLEVVFCNPARISATDGIKKTVKKLKVFNTVSKLKELLLVDVSFGQWLGMAEEAVLVPVWTNLVAVDFSFNCLQSIDESVKLLPRVECVDLSNNELTDVCHLENLCCLTHLDLSYNNIHCLDALHTKLGRVTTLKLSHNKLESLQGFARLYSLEKLDVSNNEISQVLELQHVSRLPCLEFLKLTNNPVTIVVDYRTKVLEFFRDRAKEIALDGVKASQKELDTVAILLALQKSKESREKSRKSRKLQARHAVIADPNSDSSRGQSPPLGHHSYSLPSFRSESPGLLSHRDQSPASDHQGHRGHVLDAGGQSSSQDRGGHRSSNTDRDDSLTVTSSGPSQDQTSHVPTQNQTGRVSTQDSSVDHLEGPRGPDDNASAAFRVMSPDVHRVQPRLGYQLPLDLVSPESLMPQGGTMLPETLPSRSDSTFMTHLQELLPSTTVLSRRSHTRDDRREQQGERPVHVMWCTVLCYTRPAREIMACICITTENLHMLEVAHLRGDQGMPRLVHIYCIPLVNLQQIVLGFQRQYLRIEEAFVGPQGTYALLTGSMAKTDLFLDSLKLAYRRAISDIDQYEDPHITANGETETRLLRTLNNLEGMDKAEDITISLYMLVNAVDYSHAGRPFVTHSMVMTAQYLYLLKEDYVMWPQATFAIGISTRSQFEVSGAFPIMGKITGIQMYDSDTYSPDNDTSLAQTFSATKTCAMVVPNFIGYGVKLTFDMGAQGFQSIDIRVPTSGMRDRFLATLTQLRKDHSERLTSSPKAARSRMNLRDVDTDSVSTNSAESNHGSKPKHHRHSTGARHKHKYRSYEERRLDRASGQRPDLLSDVKPVSPWTIDQMPKAPTEMPTEPPPIAVRVQSCPEVDSNDDVVDPRDLPVREAPIGQSGNSEDSSSSDESSQEILEFSIGDHGNVSDDVSSKHISTATADEPSALELDQETSSPDEPPICYPQHDNDIDVEESTEDFGQLSSDGTQVANLDSTDKSSTQENKELIESSPQESNEQIQYSAQMNNEYLYSSMQENTTNVNQSTEDAGDQGVCESPRREDIFDVAESKVECDGRPQVDVTEPPLLTAAVSRPTILKSQLSLDVQYPSLTLLTHLTECNENIQLLQPLSEVMRNLSAMEGDELLNHFHGCVAGIGQSMEELRHALWSPVMAYTKPHLELVSCVLLSTKAVYFVSDQDPRGQLSKLKEWKSHSRNKSDSYKMVRREPSAGMQDMMLVSAGVVHQCKQISGKLPRIPRTYAILPLKDIKQVTVGLFDQSFRLVGPSADLTFTCMTRDNKLTTDFIRNLTSVLAMVNPTPSPEYPSGDLDPEQDFYSMFNTYSRLESQEYRHSSKVHFVYPNEDVVNELLYVISENDSTTSNAPIHLLVYLTVYMKNLPTDKEEQIICGSIPEFPSETPNPAELGKPVTIIMSEPYLTFCREDHVHYPIPDFARGPPAFPRLRILNNRHLRHLKKIVASESTPQEITLVFADEKGIIVNPDFDHYTTYGGRVRKHITPIPEVAFTLSIQSLMYKDKLIRLLRKQCAELNNSETQVDVITEDNNI